MSNWAKYTRKKTKIGILLKLMESEQDWADYFKSKRDFVRRGIALNKRNELSNEISSLMSK